MWPWFRPGHLTTVSVLGKSIITACLKESYVMVSVIALVKCFELRKERYTTEVVMEFSFSAV